MNAAPQIGPVVLVGEVRHASDRFYCPSHTCTLSAHACLKRQARAIVENHFTLEHCRNCERGQAIEKQTGIGVESFAGDARAKVEIERARKVRAGRHSAITREAEKNLKAIEGDYDNVIPLRRGMKRTVDFRPGDKIGPWTVLGDAPSVSQGRRVWIECKVCGFKRIAPCFILRRQVYQHKCSGQAAPMPLDGPTIPALGDSMPVARGRT